MYFVLEKSRFVDNFTTTWPSARGKLSQRVIWRSWGNLRRAHLIEGIPILYMANQYYWAVLCKNRWFHRRQNLFVDHKILLGETDPYQPLPEFSAGLSIRCDDCGREYPYAVSDVVRVQLEPPDSFSPHPFFLW